MLPAAVSFTPSRRWHSSSLLMKVVIRQRASRNRRESEGHAAMTLADSSLISTRVQRPCIDCSKFASVDTLRISAAESSSACRGFESLLRYLRLCVAFSPLPASRKSFGIKGLELFCLPLTGCLCLHAVGFALPALARQSEFNSLANYR